MKNTFFIIGLLLATALCISHDGIMRARKHNNRLVKQWKCGQNAKPQEEEAPALTDEQMSEMCHNQCLSQGFCCNDFKIGSNQMLSCSQACMIRMRDSNLSKEGCQAECDGTQSGCSRTVGDFTYGMCSRCNDLTDECPHGVQNKDACMAGCEMGGPQQEAEVVEVTTAVPVTPTDDDSCLANKPSWGSQYTCASSVEWCTSETQQWVDDMNDCCPETCASVPRDDDQCIANKPDWGPDYTCANSVKWCTSTTQQWVDDTHECCPVTCANAPRDDDQCLANKEGWGPGHTCASSARHCTANTEQWRRDMHECCPSTCGV